MTKLFRKEPTPGTFAYIQAKAQRYTQVGPDVYREGDFFNMPPENWTKEKAARLTSGMHQLAEGHGATKEDPLTGLGIPGFYELLAVLHFEFDLQMLIDGGGPNQCLDRMIMRHRVDGRIVELYNLVDGPMSDVPGAKV